jgi:hypothetical protein
VRRGAVWSAVVALVDERVEQVLQFRDGGRLDGLGAQPEFQGLLEALHVAAGGGVVGAGVPLHDVQVPDDADPRPPAEMTSGGLRSPTRIKDAECGPCRRHGPIWSRSRKPREDGPDRPHGSETAVPGSAHVPFFPVTRGSCSVTAASVAGRVQPLRNDATDLPPSHGVTNRCAGSSG